MWLSTGTISLAVTGVSYVSLTRSPRAQVSLSPLLSFSWGLLLALVYGVLIAMGEIPPVIDKSVIRLITILVTTFCLLWSTIIWLHEQGLRGEMEGEGILSPPSPPPALKETARDLPRIEVEPEVPEDE